MGTIDRQRIAAVKTLEALGYTYRDGGGWRTPEQSAQWFEADVLYAILVTRADRLANYAAGSREAIEFRTIAKALQAYEAKRWPDGKEPGGKG
jgi:hypothetical protein